MKILVALTFVATSLCLVSAAPSTKVVGGSDAKEGAYPFMVSIKRYYGYSHMCGASIINKRWVLTGAHCVYDLRSDEIFITAGTQNLREPGEIYDVETIRVHEDFVYYRTGNDTALLEVNRDFNFTNPAIKALKLSSDEIPGDIKVTALGWGMYDPNYPGVSYTLQELSTLTLEPAECKEKVSKASEKEICVFVDPAKGVCSGDSGSPLVIEGTNVQVGIASWVAGCVKGLPDMYTRVSSFLPWIMEHSDSWE